MINITTSDKVILSLTSNNSFQINKLFDYVPYSKPGYRTINEVITVRNLEIKTFISSIPVIPFPVNDLTDSDSEIQLRALNNEWNNARIHLNILMSDNLLNYERIGIVSLLNQSPLPFREFSYPDTRLSPQSMIAFQTQNVGHGHLQNQDRVVITADIEREITLEKISDGIKRNVVLNADTPTLLLPENTNRSGFTIFNNSNVPVFIDIDNSVSATDFMVVLPPSAYYEGVLTQAIYGFSLQNSELLIRVFM